MTGSVVSIDLAAAFGAQWNAGLETDLPARFIVDGTSTLAWCYGTNANLTAANGVAMLANSCEVFSIPVGVTVISAIGTAGSTLRICPGDGF